MDHMISSQPRYDHFDTAAYLVVRTQIRITVSILLAFFRSAAHTRARKPLGDIAFWLLARPADVAISSQARCDHFDATLYSSVLRDGKRFYYGIFSGKFQGKPFNFSFVSLRPAFNHRAELWTCCPDRMGLRHLTGGIALRPTVFLWGLPGQYINYERALEIAGGRPLASPDLRDAVRCAALLLPGGGDMEPRRYGQANTASRGLEPERDAGELFLLEQFIMEKKPVLGICRGLQVLNAAASVGVKMPSWPILGPATPSTTSSPAFSSQSSYRAWMSGISILQGPHQVAQKFRNTVFPW